MKNSDMPAMPLTGDAYHDFSGYDGTSKTSYNPECQGLTKREMFAMNAPLVPDWFIDDWIYNNGNYRLGGSHDLVGSNRCASLDTTEMMKITKEWRYAYADLMLEE